MPEIKLKSGTALPTFGIGTDGFSDESELLTNLEEAYHLGVELIDTATGYQNHPTITKFLNKHKRENFFICTKFNNGDLLQNENIVDTVNKILQDLNTEYIDLLLIHNPAVENFPRVFEELIQLKESGKIKSLGVSNFTEKHLRQLGNNISHVDVNQVEFHPFLYQKNLFEFCKSNGITLMASRPFCKGEALVNDTIQNIASNHNKRPSQVVLRWLHQQGIVPIPKSSDKEHLEENINFQDFTLTDEEMKSIANLNKCYRTCVGPWSDFDDDQQHTACPYSDNNLSLVNSEDFGGVSSSKLVEDGLPSRHSPTT